MSYRIPPQEASSILQQQISKGEKLLQVSIKSNNSLKAAEKKYNLWNSENFELLKKIFRYDNIAYDYSKSSWSIGGIFVSDLNLSNKINKLKSNIQLKIEKLESIISSLKLLESEKSPSKHEQKVFFVHGTDCTTSSLVIEFVEQLGLQPVILKEFAAAGKTIIEEIQQQDDVHYAIGLLTPDNLGGENKHDLNFRADQNVILELGIFVGKLGRKNVSNLYVESVELPQDYHEFKHIQIDGTNDWKKLLAEELEAAGFELNL